jgi:hypothetical protein
VHAAQGGFARVEGYAALLKLGVEAVSTEFLATEGACEKPAFVCYRLRLNKKGTLKR